MLVTLALTGVAAAQDSAATPAAECDAAPRALQGADSRSGTPERFEALETMTRIGLDVDPKTAATLHRGRILRELLQQRRFCDRTVADQSIALTLAARGWVDELQPRQARELVWQVADAAVQRLPELVASLAAGTPLELGFCGAYNARVAEAAIEARRAGGPGPTLCVGRRVANHLRRRGLELDRSYPAPTSTGGITELLLHLAEDVLREYVRANLSAFDVVSNRFAGVGTYDPRATRLLPLVVERAADAPRARYTGAAHLADVAARELLYITMVELLLDAMASEHGARLVATQGAEQWLDARVAQLGRRLSSARREASTQEVIEIAAGARARRGEA